MGTLLFNELRDAQVDYIGTFRHSFPIYTDTGAYLDHPA